MITSESEQEHRHLLQLALARADLTLEQLWLRYFALGGDAACVELEAYVHGLMSLPATQRDILARAMNERLDELAWPHRVPYSRPIQARPESGPLAALLELLDGAHLAPPERIGSVVAAAGRTLGLGVMAYLVDYEQHTLVPLRSGEDDLARKGAPLRPLPVDSSLAGRAFRFVHAIGSETGGDSRLWVPLCDGVERLGVLEVMLPPGTNPYDPALREQCRWLSALLGHVLTGTTSHGDAIERLRCAQPRTEAAELIWQLLPPLTAGTDRFVLAGMVEPSHAVGGDAFDYALSETGVSIAIFDAMGHALDAGLLAAAAIAAYRSARKAGDSLEEQARRVDVTIAAHFGEDAFVTGVLVKLDLTTGRMRYVTAGHPPPFVLRSGKVVRVLGEGRRVPFGVGDAELTAGEETLQPGDWLVLHTDGVTEARDAQGQFFGRSRLIDFLEREAAAAHPPPETVRRLVQAVMHHQSDVLQDDATIVLGCWNPTPGPP